MGGGKAREWVENGGEEGEGGADSWRREEEQEEGNEGGQLAEGGGGFDGQDLLMGQSVQVMSLDGGEGNEGVGGGGEGEQDSRGDEGDAQREWAQSSSSGVGGLYSNLGGVSVQSFSDAKYDFIDAERGYTPIGGSSGTCGAEASKNDFGTCEPEASKNDFGLAEERGKNDGGEGGEIESPGEGREEGAWEEGEEGQERHLSFRFLGPGQSHPEHLVGPLSHQAPFGRETVFASAALRVNREREIENVPLHKYEESLRNTIGTSRAMCQALHHGEYHKYTKSVDLALRLKRSQEQIMLDFAQLVMKHLTARCWQLWRAQWQESRLTRKLAQRIQAPHKNLGPHNGTALSGEIGGGYNLVTRLDLSKSYEKTLGKNILFGGVGSSG